MWLVSIVSLLVVAAPGTAAAPGSATSLQVAPEPIVTRQTVFAIPFHVGRPDQNSPEPVEVQLYVSLDRGATWRLAGKVGPAQGQFIFRAAGDGEYWFVVRTLDRSGQLRPQGSNSPELRVVVDTTPPTLRLQAVRGQAGQITARWEIDETRLKPDSLKIEYRSSPSQPWQPVAVDQRNYRAAGSPQTGEVTWWPSGASGIVQIRAEVADAAGNPAISHAQVNLDSGPAPEANGRPESAPRADPVVPNTARDWSAPWRSAPSASSLPAPPSDQAPGTPVTEQPPSDLHKPPVDLQTSSTVGAAARPPASSVAIQFNPAIGNQYVPAGEKNALSPGHLPAGERPRMVNTRLFELEYDVASVGPSGISRVELWGTRDGGQTWTRFATDDDNRSPVLVSVDEEGIYGFRVVVRSGAGLGGDPPKSGDLPQVWIGVDLTKPTARITGVQQGSGDQSDQLIISWEAADAMLLADRPVSLLFCETMHGPWTTIATGLANTGRYVWPLDSRVPEKVYIRLEVRDEAGNVGTCDTKEPVCLDRLLPTGRIRDVHPLGQSSREPSRRYFAR